jgi:hypothetical protein
MKKGINLPWQVVQSQRGKISIVDCTNNGIDVISGRVCSLPQGKDGRGLQIAEHICAVVNEHGELWPFVAWRD